MGLSLTVGCLPLLLLGSSHPTHATQMPDVSCLLSDVEVTDVKRWQPQQWWDDEHSMISNIYDQWSPHSPAPNNWIWVQFRILCSVIYPDALTNALGHLQSHLNNQQTSEIWLLELKRDGHLFWVMVFKYWLRKLIQSLHSMYEMDSRNMWVRWITFSIWPEMIKMNHLVNMTRETEKLRTISSHQFIIRHLLPSQKVFINLFATGYAYMRELFQCLQWYTGGERVNPMFCVTVPITKLTRGLSLCTMYYTKYGPSAQHACFCLIKYDQTKNKLQHRKLQPHSQYHFNFSTLSV